MQDNKRTAVDFLHLVTKGRIEEAYERFVDMSGKHHNVYFAAGFAALKAAMQENDRLMPNKKFTVKNVVGEADLVTVHSHLLMEPGKELVVFHMMRFKNGKIVEFWDCGQMIPPENPNRDGAF